jgi:hypothetical protein
MMKQFKKNTQKKQTKKNIKKKLHKKIQSTLIKNLGWSTKSSHLAGSLVIGLLSTASVWHKKLVQAMVNGNQLESDIRSTQRFFSNTHVSYRQYSRMIYDMLKIDGKITVILDRTNWKFGRININIFVATILCKTNEQDQSFAVPIVWDVLDKAGTSNTQERKKLMRELLAIVDSENIEVVLADREFIGHEWVQFLLENSVPFIIRIRNDMHVAYDGKRVNPSRLFEGVKYKEKLLYDVTLNGIPVQLAGTRSIEGELVVVIASMKVTGDILSQYRLRWLIELFFKSIKSQGFNIEDTHMTDPKKIKLLFALISFATVLAVQAGIIRNHFKKITIKNHGRPAYSLFTYGLDFLRTLFRGTIPKFGPQFLSLILQPPKICFALPQIEIQNYAL